MLTSEEKRKIEAEFDRVRGDGMVVPNAIEAATVNFLAKAGVHTAHTIRDVVITTAPSLVLQALLDGYTNWSGGRKSAALEYIRSEMKQQMAPLKKWEENLHQRRIDEVRAFVASLAGAR